MGLLGLTAVQLAGYAFQFGLGELPCPLCLLQRVAFAMVTFGFLLNVRYGSQAAHYGIILLSALFGMAVAGRQTLLHIVPGSGAYGSAVFGLHFYTWAFLLFGLTVLATAVLLLLQSVSDGLPRTTRMGVACRLCGDRCNRGQCSDDIHRMRPDRMRR